MAAQAHDHKSFAQISASSCWCKISTQICSGSGGWHDVTTVTLTQLFVVEVKAVISLISFFLERALDFYDL